MSFKLNEGVMRLHFQYIVFTMALCACTSNHIDKTGKLVYDAGKTEKHGVPPEIVSRTLECPSDKSCYKIRASRGKILGIDWSNQRNIKNDIRSSCELSITMPWGAPIVGIWFYVTLPDNVVVYTETNRRGTVQLENVPFSSDNDRCKFAVVSPETGEQIPVTLSADDSGPNNVKGPSQK